MGIINAYDAYGLLEKSKLYQNQLHDVLKDELGAKKVLCISDTTDVHLTSDEDTSSIAYTIEKAGFGSELEVIQTDFIEFSYTDPDHKFGAHLPQNHDETRREYLKVDSTRLDDDLSQVENSDVILGRNCICACDGNGKPCGGIDISVEAQQNYLETLIKQQPSLIVLSATEAVFQTYPDSLEYNEQRRRAQNLYKEAKNNLIQVCENLNATQNNYVFQVIEMDENLNEYIENNSEIENGYMLVAYNTDKINFQPSTVSLENEREKAKKEVIKMDVSRQALIQEHKKILEGQDKTSQDSEIEHDHNLLSSNNK
ncbi:hypothetical protein [Legionella israelensis]|uniref:Uncharacterized protein n=1 Tax=Legionella israelensis TaxID=454 RepID=A0A0W0WNG7_9GAMM|nr:hypothetical protein [Legionella israelensis]KTD33876.1 hypothetical protein Lisr_0244 [Legionella israelensis]QBS08957.1 hypothetical protein E4T55_03225 [Legionella israelensis]SCX81711.1 hypothetical protein SAMN02746069_00314 [Legionella israelensis DSM 19235]STX58649.1 Uncharacterised protein [Legionella israelensis]